LSGRQLSLGKIKKNNQGPVLALSNNSGQIGNTIGVSGKGFRQSLTKIN
jgi:hypothetical protein